MFIQQCTISITKNMATSNEVVTPPASPSTHDRDNSVRNRSPSTSPHGV